MHFFDEWHLSRMSRRVKRGAALLDDRRPGWEAEVDLDRLRVSGFYCCPLGQLYGDFVAGALALGLWGRSLAAHGFRVTVLSDWLDRSFPDYEVLDLMWAAEVLARRRRAATRRLVAPPKAEPAPMLV